MDILVTGARGGIATAIAQHFVKHNLYLPARQDMDVCSLDSIQSYLELIPNIDLLINNAGDLYSASIKDSIPDKWLNDINVNFVGTYLTTQALLKKYENVKVINIASASAYRSYKEWSSYCASKAAVVTLTKCLANEGEEAYCICPGGVDTPFRNKIDIVNSQMLAPTEIALLIEKITQGQYNSGDSIVIKSNVLEVR